MRDGGLSREIQRAQERWGSLLRSGSPADRTVAEEALQRLYLECFLEPPRIVWLSGPLEGCMAAWGLEAQGGPVPVRALVDRDLGHLQSALRRLPDAIQAQVRSWPLEGPLGFVTRPVGNPVFAAIRDLSRDEFGGLTSRVMESCRWQAGMTPFAVSEPNGNLVASHGREMATILSLASVLRDAGQLPGRSSALLDLAAQVGWWWPMGRVAILTEPLAELHHDVRGRLHSTSGPAVRYPDGYAIHALSGVQVPAPAVERPESLDLAAILRDVNLERRRVLLERFGFDRILASGRARTLHAEGDRVLIRLELPGDEPMVLVGVTCPSTGRRYVLRVPPTITTCREAVAWTFDQSAETYSPLTET